MHFTPHPKVTKVSENIFLKAEHWLGRGRKGVQIAGMERKKSCFVMKEEVVCFLEKVKFSLCSEDKEENRKIVNECPLLPSLKIAPFPLCYYLVVTLTVYKNGFLSETALKMEKRKKQYNIYTLFKQME